MSKARLMTRPEDFQKIGIKPGIVELWEDGRRAGSDAGVNEVWYFDATMEDGTKTVVGFRPKTLEATGVDGDSPNLNIDIVMPDGKEYRDMIYVPVEQSEISKESCNVRFGEHSVVGDLKNYTIKIEPVNGIGCELHYEALVKPFRPGGTAHVALGDNDEFYYTDMSIPKNKVTGTITVDGKTIEVNGFGYHDHQWMNLTPMAAYHHWLWGRLYAGEYTLVIYDFITTERFGFTRIPILGILDGNGDVIFDNTKPVDCQIELYHQEEMKKDFPKKSNYTFNDHGKTVKLNIEWLEEIEVRNLYGWANEQQKAAYDQAGIMPTYMRYYAKADLTILEEGKADIHETGDMIYEFAYFGKPDSRAHL
ncbi:MAG: lipocalin-like domain-containing protein [Capnocytophaga sp.]|nr:lipocalin-like domain-containing protein [Capnocytophaga sp.]